MIATFSPNPLIQTYCALGNLVHGIHHDIVMHLKIGIFPDTQSGFMIDEDCERSTINLSDEMSDGVLLPLQYKSLCNKRHGDPFGLTFLSFLCPST